MQLIAVNTQEKCDALMRELEAKECKWSWGQLPTECKIWSVFTEETVIRVNDNDIIYADIRRFAERSYPDIEIIDYEIEPKKPTVSKCFDEWYKAYATESDADKIFMLVLDYFNYNIDSELVTWLDGNKETAINAILNGYEVEEEQLYYVKLPFVPKHLAYLNSNESGGIWFSVKTNTPSVRVRFTEAEIKAIDERYWEFAVRVEEDAE